MDYKWNVVYNLVMKIKKEYSDKFKDNEKLFENWISKLNNPEYLEIFQGLQLNQRDNILIIRYGLADMQKGLWLDKNSIYRECRSIVLDLDKEEIVVCPFRKFFNLDEIEENSLDNVLEEIKNAKVFEITNKLDGSMQSARYYNGEIFMAGSMAIDPNDSWRLVDGYNKLTDNMKKMIKDIPYLTFIFEYISIRDAHVVFYNKSQEGLYLIGMRNVFTGEELSYAEIKEISDKYDVPMTDIENISIDQVLEEMKEYSSFEKEGWVLNIDGHKIKIKCDDYVKLHRIMDKYSSINTVIENIADDKLDDMLSKIPDRYITHIQPIIDKILKYKEDSITIIEDCFKNAPKDNTKDFMIWVDSNCPVKLAGCVKNKFFNKPYNVLKNRANSYKKMRDLGFSEEDFI